MSARKSRGRSGPKRPRSFTTAARPLLGRRGRGRVYSVGILYFLCCVIRNAMAKVTKSVRLPVDVAHRLEQEPNQSEAIEEALREKFDL